MFKLIFKSFVILEKREKKKFYTLSFLTFFAFVLETASVGSIIPLLIFLTDNQANFNFNFLNNLSFFNNFDDKQKVNFFVIIFLSFFLLKNFYLISDLMEFVLVDKGNNYC